MWRVKIEAEQRCLAFQRGAGWAEALAARTVCRKRALPCAELLPVTWSLQSGRSQEGGLSPWLDWQFPEQEGPWCWRYGGGDAGIFSKQNPRKYRCAECPVASDWWI